MRSNSPLVNAWIDLSEDQPKDTTYHDPNSCFQRLIQKDVYQSVDILNVAFLTTVPTSATTWPKGDGKSYTLSTGNPPYVHPTPRPEKLTNEDYLTAVVADARANNRNIKILATLVWGEARSGDPASDGMALAQIFPADKTKWKEAADAFAANLIEYLDHYDMDGFDIDWEPSLSTNTKPEQFTLLLNAIGARKLKPKKRYYLTLSPSTTENLQPAVVKAINASVDFLNLQLYFSRALGKEFTGLKVDAKLLAYGAKFEKDFNPAKPPDRGHQSAQDAFDDNRKHYGYSIFTCWRLNSGNYIFEQDQQQALYKLVPRSKIKDARAV